MMEQHARAFNFARRYSAKNENDLLQESFVEDDDSPKSFGVTENFCASLLEKHFPAGFEVPAECHRYGSFRKEQSKHKDDVAIAFSGMSPREALQAETAREHGRLNNAQILRRMSSRSKKSETSWF